MAIAFVAVVVSAVTSCGKENSDGEITSDDLIGTWLAVKFVDELNGDEVYVDRMEDGDVYMLTFDEDGTCLEYDGYDDSFCSWDYFYSHEAGKLIVDHGEEVCQVTKLSSNALILKIEDYRSVKNHINDSVLDDVYDVYNGFRIYRDPTRTFSYCYKSGGKYYFCESSNDDFGDTYYYDSSYIYFKRAKVNFNL